MLLLLTGAILLTGGCGIASDYQIADGTTHTRCYSTVAGAVRVGESATIGSAETVAGEISVEAGAHTGDLTSVAGEIRVAENVHVDGGIKTVAGGIRIRRGGVITGNVVSVAGNIDVNDSEIQGSVTQTAGNVELAWTRVADSVRIKHTRHDTDRPARVNIGPGCDVRELVVEDKANAEVRIHRSAKVGSIKGVTPEYYD